MATIDSYIECLSNCSGRFRRLSGAWPLTDSEGNPFFMASSRSVLFRIVYGGRRYLLRCPLSMSAAERAMTEKFILEIRHLDNPFIARPDYLPSELLIHDSHGKPSRVDVIIEEEPEGEPLHLFLRGRRMLSEKPPLRELLKSLSIMSEDLHRFGLIHGNLQPQNVIVSESGRPVAVNYAMSHDKREQNDTCAMALLALNTYLAGCGSRIMVEMAAGGGRAKNYLRSLEHIRTQAEFLRLGPLTAITAMLLGVGGCDNGLDATEQGGTMLPKPAAADRMEFNAAAAALAETPFVQLPLLESLTAESGSEEELWQDAAASTFATTSALRHTLRSHNEDNTLRIDFGKCDFVAPMADTLVRFCIKGQWGFADRYGTPVIKAGFLDAGDFYEGLAVVATAQGYGVINRRGQFVMEPAFEAVEWYGPDNVIAACADGKWELYDRTGRRLTAGAYDWLGDCSEGTFLARRGNRFGYLLADGSSLTDMRFDDAYSFRGGTATVKSGNEIYYIDKSGRKMIDNN